MPGCTRIGVMQHPGPDGADPPESCFGGWEGRGAVFCSWMCPKEGLSLARLFIPPLLLNAFS